MELPQRYNRIREELIERYNYAMGNAEYDECRAFKKALEIVDYVQISEFDLIDSDRYYIHNKITKKYLVPYYPKRGLDGYGWVSEKDYEAPTSYTEGFIKDRFPEYWKFAELRVVTSK